jgi:hypothetical protein
VGSDGQSSRDWLGLGVDVWRRVRVDGR